MLYAYITGGGTKWIYDSLKKGGASKWFLGSRIPYNQKDFNEILGGEPFDGKYVSKRTSAQLAASAYNHAVELTGDEGSIGLGVTAKLGTKGQRKDRDNKIIVSILRCVDGNLQSYTMEKTFCCWIPRCMQEILSSLYIERFIKCPTRYDTSRMYTNHFSYLHGLKSNDKGIVVYSGSFNPIHDSHKLIIEHSKRLFSNHRFVLEISTKNFSKGIIGPYEMDYRDCAIAEKYPLEHVVFSNESTFLEKAKLLNSNGFKYIIFPMGDDTYDRITKTEKNELVNLGVACLVFRRHKETLEDDHNIIHAESFYLPKLENLSSTEIRKQNAI